MDQYLLIPFLGEWTSIYQLFWCSPGVQGLDTLPYVYAGDIVILYHPFSTAKKKTTISSHPKAAPRPVGLLDTLEVHEPQVKRFRGRVGMVFSVGFYQGKWWFLWDFHGISPTKMVI